MSFSISCARGARITWGTFPTCLWVAGHVGNVPHVRTDISVGRSALRGELLQPHRDGGADGHLRPQAAGGADADGDPGFHTAVAAMGLR